MAQIAAQVGQGGWKTNFEVDGRLEAGTQAVCCGGGEEVAVEGSLLKEEGEHQLLDRLHRTEKQLDFLRYRKIY